MNLKSVSLHGQQERDRDTMAAGYLIGLDYGTESARGVLIDAASGEQIAHHVHPYRHGVMSRTLADGHPLPEGWALQDADDYVEAAQEILTILGRGRQIASIGIGFTASTPMPAAGDGTPLSRPHPDNPHAYVKLWKHAAAQKHADRINAAGGDFLANFGGRLSGEWLLAKAAQIAEEAPDIWAQADRFIEAGDWLVWQLTGHEVRSLGFAAYKAQHLQEAGYPAGLVGGLESRLSEPEPIGSAAGPLSAAWRERTGIAGPAVVAVAVIDSHVVLPAVDDLSGSTLVAALGTSAVYLYLSETFRPLPPGIEGVAWDGTIAKLWCYEAGQAGFGDSLAWFVRNFPVAESEGESFRQLGEASARLAPGQSGLIALDWWSGNRVPWANSSLSGMIAGFTMRTTPAEVYRAILESLCFGARTIMQRFVDGGLPVERVILTSGLVAKNPLLVRIMADVLGRPVHLPQIDNPTSVGAAIHGAVAAGLVADYSDGRRRYGARTFSVVEPDPDATARYEELFRLYTRLSEDAALRQTLLDLNAISSGR